jgi:hypothetical protein
VVIKTLQQTVLKAIQTDDARLDESDVGDRLLRFGEEKGWEEQHLKKVLEHFVEEGARFKKTLKTAEYKSWLTEASGAPTNIALALQDVPLANFIPCVPKPIAKHKRFLIVFTRNRHFARLHRVVNSNCPWVRNQVKDCIELDSVEPNLYDARCRICWPEVAAQEGESDSSLSEE